MNTTLDVVEAANRAGKFRVFLQAIEAAGLKETLRETGPYTVLAPVDDAFVKIEQSKLQGLFKPEKREALRALLRNHIVSGKLNTGDLKERDKIKTMNGEKLGIDSRGDLMINEANVVIPDLDAFNGVLHGVDLVLLPQTRAATAG